MNRLAILMVTTGVLSSLTACASPGRTPAPQGFTVDEVVTTLKRALAEAKAEIIDSGLPDFESATVTLQTELVKTTEAGVKLFVVGGTKSRETGQTNQLELTLVPHPAGEAPIAGSSLYEQLKKAIVEAAEASKHARASGKPELDLSSVSVDLEFSVKKTTSGSLELEIYTVGISGGRTESLANTHKISLSFKAKEAKDK